MACFFYRCVYTLIHIVIDLWTYRLPRLATIVLLRLPVSVIEALGRVPYEARLCASGADRRIRIITAPFVNHTGTPEGVAQAQDEQRRIASFLRSFGLPTNESVLARQPVRRGTRMESYEGPLYNGHVHTLLGAFRPLSHVADRHREVLESYDGCRVCVDFYLPAEAACPPLSTAPPTAFALLLPGLTGSSTSSYIQRMLRVLLPMNIAVGVLNARGVDDTPLDKPQIFSALFTQDLRYVLQHYLTRGQIQARLGAAQPVPVFGVAFSLGGLILSNFAAEQGEAGLPSGLDAIITVCSPHNVADCDASIRRPLSQLLYGPSTTEGLRAYYHRHKDMLERLPGVNHSLVFSRDPKNPKKKPLIERMRSVHQFDHDVTAPHFGFRSAIEYYNEANNFRRLGHSLTPQLCLVARDDPFCGPAQPRRTWEKVALAHKAGLACVEFPVGGHIGFVGNPMSEWSGRKNEMELCVEHMLGTYVHMWYAQPEEAQHRERPSCPKGSVVARDTPAT